MTPTDTKPSATSTKADAKSRRDVNEERRSLIGQAQALLDSLSQDAGPLLTRMGEDKVPAGLAQGINNLAKVAKTLGKVLNQASIRYEAPAKAKASKPAPEPKAEKPKAKGKTKAAKAEAAPE